MPRKTSDVTDTEFPFDEDTTPFILVFNFDDEQSEEPTALAIESKDWERGYAAAWTVQKKYDLVLLATDLREANVECSLLATWPGAQATHVFEIDDLDEARDALG